MNNKMAINTYLSIIKSIKEDNQAEQKQTHRHREYINGSQMGGVGGGAGENSEGIKKHKLVVTEQSQGCKGQHREQGVQSVMF